MEGQLLTKGIYAGNVTHRKLFLKGKNTCHTFLAIRDHSSDRESVQLSWWEQLSLPAWSYWHHTCSSFLEFTTWSPAPDHRKRQKKQRTARYYVQTIMTHQGSYSQFAVTFREVELILSRQCSSLLSGKPQLLPCASLGAVCPALPATHTTWPSWKGWDDAPSHFDLWHLPE